MKTEIVVEELIKAFIAFLSGNFINLFKGIKNEFLFLIKDNISKYLARKLRNYSFLKTFLHSESPVYFYTIYEDLNISNTENTINTKYIKNLFSNTNFISIAGSGKSTLLKHLFISSIRDKFKIPIFIEFRYIKAIRDFTNYVKRFIFKEQISAGKNIIERMLINGMFVFFFDGFDETNEDDKGLMLAEFQNFYIKYENNNFILTSRPVSIIITFPNFIIIQLIKSEKNVYSHLLNDNYLIIRNLRVR